MIRTLTGGVSLKEFMQRYQHRRQIEPAFAAVWRNYFGDRARAFCSIVMLTGLVALLATVVITDKLVEDKIQRAANEMLSAAEVSLLIGAKAFLNYSGREGHLRYDGNPLDADSPEKLNVSDAEVPIEAIVLYDLTGRQLDSWAIPTARINVQRGRYTSDHEAIGAFLEHIEESTTVVPTFMEVDGGIYQVIGRRATMLEVEDGQGVLLAFTRLDNAYSDFLVNELKLQYAGFAPPPDAAFDNFHHEESFAYAIKDHQGREIAKIWWCAQQSYSVLALGALIPLALVILSLVAIQVLSFYYIRRHHHERSHGLGQLASYQRLESEPIERALDQMMPLLAAIDMKSRSHLQSAITNEDAQAQHQRETQRTTRALRALVHDIRANACTVVARDDVMLTTAELKEGDFRANLLRSAVNSRLSLETEILQALRQGEFEVFYHPKVDLGTGDCLGAEALIRWRRANGELVMPNEFIPFAEQTGQIVSITRFVIEKVFEDFKDGLLGWCEGPIAVNLSPPDLADTTLPGFITKKARQLSIDPKLMSFEITERGVLELDKVKDQIFLLRNMGHKVVIDDFGTGFANLNLLHELVVDGVKLDRVFVATLSNDHIASMVPYVVQVAADLNIDVVAEGVETEEQRQALVSAGVHHGQGWFYSKPLERERFIDFLKHAYHGPDESLKQDLKEEMTNVRVLVS